MQPQLSNNQAVIFCVQVSSTDSMNTDHDVDRVGVNVHLCPTTGLLLHLLFLLALFHQLQLQVLSSSSSSSLLSLLPSHTYNYNHHHHHHYQHQTPCKRFYSQPHVYYLCKHHPYHVTKCEMIFCFVLNNKQKTQNQHNNKILELAYSRLCAEIMLSCSNTP